MEILKTFEILGDSGRFEVKDCERSLEQKRSLEIRGYVELHFQNSDHSIDKSLILGTP